MNNRKLAKRLPICIKKQFASTSSSKASAFDWKSFYYLDSLAKDWSDF